MNKYVIAVLMAVTSILSVSAEDLFPGLEDTPGVESVYISKSMMINYATSRDILWDKLNLYKVDKLDGMMVYSGRSEEAMAAIEKSMKTFIDSKKNMETLVKSKTAKDMSVIYGLPLEDKKGYSVLIIFNKGNDCSMVVLTGEINLTYGAMANI